MTTDRLRLLAQELQTLGRVDDAVLLLDHLAGAGGDQAALAQLIDLLIGTGRTAAALQAMTRLEKRDQVDAEITARYGAFINESFRESKRLEENGDDEGALAILEALNLLLPRHPIITLLALACSQKTDDIDRTVRFAQLLMQADPDHPMALLVLIDDCRRRQDVGGEIRHRTMLMQKEAPLPALDQAHNLYELINLMSCRPLPDAEIDGLAEAQQRLLAIPAASVDRAEDRPWVHFYQVMVGAIDLAALRQPQPMKLHPAPALTDAGGKPLTLPELQQRARRLGAETVFLVAADESYVRRYARFYTRSVLHNAGIPCLVLVHVIGGAGKMPEIAAAIGIIDDRLILSCDAFDAAQFTSRVLDAPTRGPISRPITHYQSDRFHHVGWLLPSLGLPVFVNDIDCLLERGVRPLMEQHRGCDFVINENHVIFQFAARITANLLLFFPTPATERFALFLSSYLDGVLQAPEQPKFLDQIALNIAQHYIRRTQPAVRIGRFDVDHDINNCILTDYAAHPFCFLSLYQQFDLATLPEMYR